MTSMTELGLSGAFRPGLIEARHVTQLRKQSWRSYPGHFAPASLKLRVAKADERRNAAVIRGISPRPH